MFSVRQFRGVAPRVDARLMQDVMAQIAQNCRLWHGNLQPFNTNLAVLTLPKVGPILSIHRFGHDTASDSQYWFHWASDVDVVRSQVFGDVQERTYYTDGVQPMVTDNTIALSGGGTSYPNNAYILGIPAPAATPTVAKSGVPANFVQSITVDSGGSGYTTPPVVVISAPGTGGTQATAIAEITAGVVTSITVTNSGTDYTTATVSFTGGGGGAGAAATAVMNNSLIAETRVYAYTYVSAWGEEGKPCAASASVDVVYGESVDLSGMSVAPVGAYNITSKRIYRSVLGTGGTDYLFVAEIPVAQTTYSDTIKAENLGEVIPSVDYDMPPAGLKGLVNLPNGISAGFLGKDVYFSEPYKPHTFPIKYSVSVDFDIVALGVTDTTLVVLTTGMPSVIQGTHPENMAEVKVELPQACASKRSVAFMAGQVVYASPDGLMAIGNGTQNLTEALYTADQWRDTFAPSSIHGYVFDNKYIGFYNNGVTTGGFILDPVNANFTTLDWYANAGYYDAQRDALFLVTGTNDLVKFDQGAGKLTAVWKSKKHYEPSARNPGWIRVEADAYPVSVEVIADGVSKGTFSVTSKKPQRLLMGYKANDWEFKATTTTVVHTVQLATALDEMRYG